MNEKPLLVALDGFSAQCLDMCAPWWDKYGVSMHRISVRTELSMLGL